MKKVSIFGLAFVALVGNAFATGENIVTSKKYVDDALAGKQPTINRPADDGKVVMYTSTPGQLGAKPVYDETGTYTSAQQDSLIEAKNVNTAIQNGLNAHVVCDDNPVPADLNDCLLWRVVDLNGTYVPTGSSGGGNG